MFETGGTHEPWLGALLAVASLHLLVARYASVRSASGDVPGGVTPGEYVDGDVVTCPECGADNELGYRFCRHCVGDLPGADERATATGPSRSGSVF